MNAIQYLLLALILLTASCKNEALNHDEEVADLNEIGIELPIANSAKKSKIHHQAFLTIGNNDYHHEGYPKTEKLTDIEKSLSLEYKKIRKGSSPFLSLIATGDIPFSRITNGIRAAARAGFADISFAVKPSPDAANTMKYPLPLRLPVMDGSPSPTLHPILIKASDSGAVYIQNGSNQQVLDEGLHLRNLPQLQEYVGTYYAAAKAGEHTPSAQIYVEPNTPHQRAIDILNTLHATGFRKIIFTSYEDKPQRPRRGFRQNKLSPSATPIAPPFKNPIKN